MKYTPELHNRLREENSGAWSPEVSALLDELERLQSAERWHKYPDEKPEKDDLIYQVILEENGNEWCEHAWLSFVHGWATHKKVLWYRAVPNTPAPPDIEEGEFVPEGSPMNNWEG